MVGILWFIFWQAVGLVVAAAAFGKKRWPVRLWLGSVLGSVLSAWAPIPFSFIQDFTVASHLTSLSIGLILVGFSVGRLKKHPMIGEMDPENTAGDKALLWLLRQKKTLL